MDQVADAEAPYSANWWEERSSEQLQEMVRAGLSAGEYGAGAVRELERRARRHAAAKEREAEVLVAEKQDRRIKILAGILVALLVTMGIVLLIR